MTIAGFYLCPEGVVLGADSTSSALTASGMHYFNFNQKIYEVGEDGSLGVLTWGLGALGAKSYRTLIAELADELKLNPATSVAEVMQRFIDLVWPVFSAYDLKLKYDALALKPAHDPANPSSRTATEEQEFTNLRSGLVVGFCIAGFVAPNRSPVSCSVLFDPTAGKPTANEQQAEGWSWWGVPNLIQRLVFGADPQLKGAVLASGKWTGTDTEFDALVAAQTLAHASLPIRDAIDYVHSSIYCTIKAMKFSSFAQVCGGPIEIAVITTDRKFRWVRHKSWDAAINDGEI